MSMLKLFKINIFLTAVFFLCIFSFALTAKAQTLGEITNNIQVSLSPQYPVAGSNVSIHLQTNTTDLNQATISWIIGGKVQNKGLGMTDFIATAGKIGSVTTVTAQIKTSDKGTVNKVIKIQPTDIDLLWQASSYVPPFYQGKALYPHQGLITFTAIPNVSATKDITKSIGLYLYRWQKDGDVLTDFSGYGKNTFSLRGPTISQPFVISVEVISTDGVTLGSAAVKISPRSPKVALYENNPLLGILYNNNLSSFSMHDKELSVSSVPYYFNSGGEPVSLDYKWTMNGQSISSQSDPSTITVRNTTGSAGSATIGVQIKNTLKALQLASDSMSVTFGSTDNQNNL